MNAIQTATMAPASQVFRFPFLSWPPRFLGRALPIVLLSCLTGALFFPRLDERDLWSSHEGRAAQDAQSLLLDRAWGLPKLFCLQADLQKPPLYYWLVAG